jgi:hypothetical protein
VGHCLLLHCGRKVTRCNFFFLLQVGWDRVCLVRGPLISLLYQPRTIDDECGAVGGMRIARGNRSTPRKPSPVPLCPSQIQHDLSRPLFCFTPEDWGRASFENTVFENLFFEDSGSQPLSDRGPVISFFYKTRARRLRNTAFRHRQWIMFKWNAVILITEHCQQTVGRRLSVWLNIVNCV